MKARPTKTTRPGSGSAAAQVLARKNNVVVALALRAFRDAQIRTVAFGYLFAVFSYIQPVGYRHTYPTRGDRLAFARSFAENTGLRLMYGQPNDIVTVGGYTAWRVGGVLAIVAAAFGLFAAVRALRAEEDSGRTEIVLAAMVGRRAAAIAALAAIAAGALLLWLAEFAGFLVGGLPTPGAAYLALATASVAPVFVGVGALASQLAPTRRGALGVGGAVLGLLFTLRVVADTVPGAGWLRWSTPLGWAELLHPFAGPQPLVLVLPAGATVLLLVVSTSLAAQRDIGTGMWPAHDSADPHPRLLRTPAGHALRNQRGTLISWIIAVGVLMFVLGGVSQAISPADIPANTRTEIAKLGAGSITTPIGYFAFVFLFVSVAVSAFACAQIGAARQEEADQQLETLLAEPISRTRWLSGRMLLAAAGVAALSLTAGLLGWAGARVAGAPIALFKMLEAGANAIPIALLFLGLTALAYALAPRASGVIGYALLAVALLWHVAGSLIGPPRWILDLTPFAHVGLVPAHPVHIAGSAVVTGIALLAGVAALAAFRRRDLAAG